ncbi:MAG: carbohydrate ABC transporter permease [Pleomorphochaeta sp.]
MNQKIIKFLDREGVVATVLLLPSLVIIFGILLSPLVSAIYLSFTDLHLTNPNSGIFIGLKNYFAAVKDPIFWQALSRTLIFCVFTVICEVSLGLLVAFLLNRNFKGRGFVRGFIILPWALPYVVNGIMWKWIFDANYGALNALLTQIGIIDQYQIWLGNPATALSFVIIANIWKETPVAIIMILSALQSFPNSLREAAELDGANKFQTTTKIVLPFLKPIIFSLVLIKTIWALKEFDLIFIMTKGGPADGTNLLSYYIYQNTFTYLKFGYGTALAVLLTVLTLFLAFFYKKGLGANFDVDA